MMLLLSRDAPTLPTNEDEGDDGSGIGLRAMPRSPSGVELGFIFLGSETDRKEGSRFGASLDISMSLSSSGVPASEESSESPGVGRSTCSSGVVADPASVPFISMMMGSVRCKDAVERKMLIMAWLLLRECVNDVNDVVC